MIFLNGRGRESSEHRARAHFPPVVEYGDEDQQREADKLAAMPEESVIVGWLSDYAVLRKNFSFAQNARI
jgi:hypothetical protein